MLFVRVRICITIISPITISIIFVTVKVFCTIYEVSMSDALRIRLHSESALLCDTADGDSNVYLLFYVSDFEPNGAACFEYWPVNYSSLWIIILILILGRTNIIIRLNINFWTSEGMLEFVSNLFFSFHICFLTDKNPKLNMI